MGGFFLLRLAVVFVASGSAESSDVCRSLTTRGGGARPPFGRCNCNADSNGSLFSKSNTSLSEALRDIGDGPTRGGDWSVGVSCLGEKNDIHYISATYHWLLCALLLYW